MIHGVGAVVQRLHAHQDLRIEEDSTPQEIVHVEQDQLKDAFAKQEEFNEIVAMRKRLDEENNLDLVKATKQTVFQRLKQNLSKKSFSVQGISFKERKFIQTGVESEYDIRSLWILNGKWWIRKKIVWLIEWRQFESFISIVIIANSIMLSCIDYSDREFAAGQYYSINNLNEDVMGDAFTFIFLLECVLKILGMGFCLHKNSYMRDYWNWLDLIVVTVSVIGWIPSISNNQSMKALRTIRILRPLRSIKSIPSMRALIQALLASLPGLLNVGTFLIFVFTIFAIFGTHQFAGSQYQRCRTTLQPILNQNTNQTYWPINYSTQWLCNEDNDCFKLLNGQIGDNGIYKCGSPQDYGLPIESDNLWKDYVVFFNIPNFDNIIRSWYLIFQNVTMEGWTLLMYNWMDSNNFWIAAIYQCSTIIVIAWFTMQLILAQIFDTFAEEHEKKLQQMQDKALEEQQKAEIANMFVSGLKGQHEIKIDELLDNQLHKNCDQNEENENENKPAVLIANNLQIFKTLAKRNENKSLNHNGQAEKQIPKLDISSDEEIQNQQADQENLRQWITNKKEKFPQEQENKMGQDSDDDEDFEYENQTKYELNSKNRSKSNFFIRKMYKLVNTPLYNFFVFCLIIGNTLALAVDGYPSSFEKQTILKALNEFFTWAFLTEMIMKIIALGLNNYVHDNFNLFDAIVVSCSIVDWSLNQSLTTTEIGQIGLGMKAIKALRLLRIIKIARSWQYLLYIIKAILKSVKDILNFGVLYFLYLYIFALLGMQLFSHYTKIQWNSQMTSNVQSPIQDVINTKLTATQNGIVVISPHYNFDNIYNALIVCFCNTMAEDWNNAMYVFAVSPNQNQQVTMIYFMFLFYGGNSIMLALFTAILLQNFDETDEETKAKILLEASKPKFEWRKIFSKEYLVGYKNAFITVFDPKGKKKLKQSKEQNSNSNPKNFGLQIDLNRPILPQKIKFSAINLLHYEIHEKQTTKITLDKELEKIELDGYSLFCFGPQNSIRIACYIIVNNKKYFENFILILILLSTVCLALNSPLIDPQGQLANVLNQIDFVMTSFFICEMLTKWIADGFAFCGPKSYIKNGWNILDFIIVISATIAVIFQSINISFIKSFRVLRVLRPLRLISKHQGLKQVVSALIYSMPNIMNLLLIIIFFIFLLGILSVTLFGGQLWSCQMTQLTNTSVWIQVYGVTNRYNCLMYGGEWVNNDYNYDNILQAMLCLVGIQSTENWVTQMWYTQDSIAEEIQPMIDSNRVFDVYCVFQQMFITLLCLNLYVGVVLESFNYEKDKLSLNSLLTKIESMWIDNLKQCYQAAPKIQTAKTDSKIRNYFIHLCDSKEFKNFVLCSIVGNAIVLCFKWNGQDPILVSVLDNINLVFAGIFTVEACLKLFAYRKNYFRENWNIFDFFVVVLTWVIQILLSINLPADVSILGMIARTLRIFRVFRLVRRVKAIKIILYTLYQASSSITVVALLLFLVFFMYAIIGMSLFPFVMWNWGVYLDQLNRHYHFQDFVTAFLVLMRNSTGEAWDSAMYDCARQYSIMYQCNPNADYYSYMNNGQVADGCGQGILAIIYFYSFYVIAVQIFLNLFIAVIIDSFLDQSKALGMPVNVNDIEDFIDCWQLFDLNGDGFIECKDFEKFIVQLAKTKSKIILNKKRILKNSIMRRRYISFLEIPSHNNFQKFLFADVLQCMTRQVIENQYIRQEILEQKKKKFSLYQQKIKNEIGIEQMKKEVQLIIEKNRNRNFKQEFLKQVNGISDKNQEIVAVNELFNIAKKSQAIKMKNFDQNVIDENEYYTSKHYIYGDLIVRCWHDFVHAKQIEIDKHIIKLEHERNIKRESGIKFEQSLHEDQQNISAQKLISGQENEPVRNFQAEILAQPENQ